MMKILDRLPISEQGWFVPTPDGAEEAKPYQMIVSVSITDQEVFELPESALRFPAILDTGNNHNFAIRQTHLERWPAIMLPRKGWIEVGGHFVPLLAANIWIHPNRAGTNEPRPHSPSLLKLEEGMAVYPPNIPNPARLPILGLRAIIRNGLKLTIDGAPRELTIESASP